MKIEIFRIIKGSNLVKETGETQENIGGAK